MSKFTHEEQQQYEERLKYYRDIKNVVDTSKEEGKQEGRLEEKLLIAKAMMESGESIDKIVQYTKLSKEEIQRILK